MDIQDVQHQFFHAVWAKVYIHYFLPTPKPGHPPFEQTLPSWAPHWFPLPGGYTIIVAMLINLLAAHTVRASNCALEPGRHHPHPLRPDPSARRRIHDQPLCR